MNDLEVELARLFAEPMPAGDGDLPGRVRSILRARGRVRRSLALAGASAAYGAALAAALMIWKLAETALPAFDFDGGAEVLVRLPFIAAIAIVALAARCVAAAILRSGTPGAGRGSLTGPCWPPG